MDFSTALACISAVLAFMLGAHRRSAWRSRDALERRREEQFRRTVEASPAGLVLVDARGRISLVNSAIERSFGYGREELLGRDVHLLVPDDLRRRHPDTVASFLADPRRVALDASRDLCGRRRDGSHFPVEVGLTPIDTSGGLQILCSVVDVTERKRDEARIVEKTRELERSNRELEEFASVVSHDLKSPLRGIVSLAEWIAADYAEVLDEAGLEQLDLLRERTLRMHRMIEGILEYSRAGRGSDPPRVLETARVVRAVVELLAPPPNIAVRIEQPLPPCHCNETQAAQVFQNLIGNAIQHLGKPCGAVTIRGVPGPDRVEFTVSDDGVGIAPEHHARIFRIFQRLRTDPKEASTGIGLSIVQKIVQRNGGELAVESRPGEGTTFRFSLPGLP